MSVVETLALFRKLLTAPKFLVVRGEPRLSGWNAKALGYGIVGENYPAFTDEELIQAINDGKGIAIPTGEKSDWLFTIEYDLSDSDSLGSRDAAKAWLIANLWRLEKLGTIVVESPRHGFHVYGTISSGKFNPLDPVLDDWLEIIEEDLRIKPDTIHFRSVNGSDYAILPPSPGYSFLGKCRTIKRPNL